MFVFYSLTSVSNAFVPAWLNINFVECLDAIKVEFLSAASNFFKLSNFILKYSLRPLAILFSGLKFYIFFQSRKLKDLNESMNDVQSNLCRFKLTTLCAE